MSLSLPLPADRAQSETVGVVLLTGVVVIIVAVVGGIVLSGIGTGSQTPVVDIRGNATSEHVMVTHNGGDSLPRSEVDIITDGDQRVRHSLDTYTQRIGSDDTRFERGDSWRRSNEVAGDRITLIAIHTPSNTVLDRATVDVRVTSFARFTYDPQNPTPTSTVEFDASDSEFDGGTVDTYEWDFDDDGTTDATGQTASYSFPDDGDYPVTLTITADDGRTANRTKTVTVYNDSPDASFTYSPTNPDPGEQITFDGSGSSDPDGTVDTYEWDFDDDGTYEDTGETATHTYSTEGDKTATLRVTDDDGATSRESKTVTVRSGGQILAFDSLVKGKGGEILFEVDNTESADVTVTRFAVDATSVDNQARIDNGQSPEVEIAKTGIQDGVAETNGNYKADGTRYDFDTNAIIAGNGGSDVIIKGFEDQRGSTLEFELQQVDNSADADVTVTLVLENNPDQTYYFEDIS